MSDDGLELPAWAVASPARRAHIARVTELALSWGAALRIDGEEREAWRDAARWHDALRDASDAELRAIVPDLDWSAPLLHGPAAAARFAQDGERRTSVLDAIHWHTIGNAEWDRTGRMLYMADFLEPARTFDREERERLAARVTTDFEGTYREVVKRRLAARIASEAPLRAETIALWESVQ